MYQKKKLTPGIKIVSFKTAFDIQTPLCSCDFKPACSCDSFVDIYKGYESCDYDKTCSLVKNCFCVSKCKCDFHHCGCDEFKIRPKCSMHVSCKSDVLSCTVDYSKINVPLGSKLPGGCDCHAVFGDDLVIKKTIEVTKKGKKIYTEYLNRKTGETYHREE